MKFGIDRLLTEPELRKPLAGKRVALLAHPASVTADLTHALDALAALDRDTTYLVYCQCGGRSTEAVKLMEDRRISQLPVLDARRHLVGALHLHDLLTAKVV